MFFKQIGSLEYLDHTPGGGDVVLPKNDVKWRAKSKINSLNSLRVERRLLRELDLYEDYITGMYCIPNDLNVEKRRWEPGVCGDYVTCM